MQLEAEIHSIKNEQAAMSKEQAAMSQEISLIRQAMEFASSEKEEFIKAVKELTVSNNRLELTISKKDGVEQGQYTVLKWVSTVVGLFASAWIFWATNSIVSNNSYIDYLKKEAETKRNIQR